MTTAQQGFYWAAIIPTACQVLGVDHDTCHEILKLEHNPKPSKIDRRTGEVLEFRGGSTMALSTSQCVEFFDRIEKWLNAHGVQMPDPKDYLERAATAAR